MTNKAQLSAIAEPVRRKYQEAPQTAVKHLLAHGAHVTSTDCIVNERAPHNTLRNRSFNAIHSELTENHYVPETALVTGLRH